MVTQFNESDLVSFGNYLLSDRRKKRYECATQEALENKVPILSTEERLKEVSHADLANWLDLQSERKFLKKMNAIAEESLSPEMFEKWIEVRSQLNSTRESMK